MKLKDFKLINENWQKYLGEKALEGEPSFQGVHPLIDGLYDGNGYSASTMKQIPAAIEVMQSNPENEHFKVALAIYNGEFMVEGSPLPYFPFDFEKGLLKELVQAGLSPEDARRFEMEFSSRENEYQVPYSDDY